MASINWKKVTAKQLNNYSVHFDLMERERHKHSNEDINTLLTRLNYDMEDSYYDSIRNLKNKVEEFDKIIPPKKKFGYDKRIIAVALEVICPDEIANLYQNAEDDFFKTIYKCEKQFFGEDLVCYGGVHKDEVHTYINSKKNTLETSRSHLHTFIIPYTKEFGVNGREFCRREIYYRFNKYCDSAIYNQFKIHLNNGIGKNNWGNVESLKENSKEARRKLGATSQENLLFMYMNEEKKHKMEQEADFLRVADLMWNFRNIAPKQYEQIVQDDNKKFGFKSIISKVAKMLSVEEYGDQNWIKDPIWAELEREEEEKKKKRKKELEREISR